MLTKYFSLALFELMPVDILKTLLSFEVEVKYRAPTHLPTPPPTYQEFVAKYRKVQRNVANYSDYA